MQVKEIEYERIRNLGNFETERLGVTYRISPADDEKEVFKKAKEFVTAQLFSGSR